MPITIKKNQLFIKNSSTGQYNGFDVAADHTCDEIYELVNKKVDKENTVLLTTLSRGRAEGKSGTGSIAFGENVTASGSYSHAEGVSTIANHRSQNVSGEYNVADASFLNETDRGQFVEIIGNGASSNLRSNARTLDWDGNEHLSGNVYVESNVNGTDGKKLATEEYVNSVIPSGASLSFFVCDSANNTPNATTIIIEGEQTPGTLIASSDTLSKIYLVPVVSQSSTIYDEYVTVEPDDSSYAWVKLGSTTMDLSNYVKKTDYATTSNAGVVKLSSSSAVTKDENNNLHISVSDSATIKIGTNETYPLTAGKQHESVFYGLAKAAGDTTQASSLNVVGAYTENALTAIKSMLDIQPGTMVVRLI